MSLASLIATGTKVWLDGIEPDDTRTNLARGITGATSNPSIVSKIIAHGLATASSATSSRRASTTTRSPGDSMMNWSTPPSVCSCPCGSRQEETTAT